MKKYILTESQFKSLTQSLISEETIPTEVKVSLNFKSSYPVNSSDPKEFLGDFTTALMKKINSTPNGQQMLKSGKMTIYSIKVEAGASNTWLGQTTPYDYENNYQTKSKTTDTKNELYKKNVTLANQRATTFKTYLVKELGKYSIKESPSVGVSYATKVINTGGVKDEVRDTNLYKNPGQYIYVSITFRYPNEIVPKTDDIPPQTGYTTVERHMVLTGSYYCNGKSSEGQGAQANVYVKQCEGLPDDKKDKEHMSVFEIKWNQDVVKDARVRPMLRWSFTWGSNNKIIEIVRISGTKPEYVPEGTAPKIKWEYKHISGDDPELIHYMNINGVDVHGRYIKPYL